MLYLVTSEAPRATRTVVYESAAETAKNIRKALKAAFPGVTFRVRSSTFSMGSSVDVYWEDMPIRRQVEKLVAGFASSTFDGMDDSTTDHGYLLAGVCHMGAKYVSSQVTISKEMKPLLVAYANANLEMFERRTPPHLWNEDDVKAHWALDEMELTED